MARRFEDLGMLLFAAEAAAALAVGGYTDPAIAGRLYTSIRTVQTHLAHIYVKLGINRRTDLASRLS